jgi:hypothetical protein
MMSDKARDRLITLLWLLLLLAAVALSLVCNYTGGWQ